MDVGRHRREGLWQGLGNAHGVGWCFGGKAVDGAIRELDEIVRELIPPDVETAWLRQIHSARVVEAQPGDNGEADALITRRAGLALAVVTADCVPVLLSAPGEIAAVHAGWRGLAGGILPATLERLGSRSYRGSETAHGITAWIGPAIGRCCYEVDEDVASRIASASSPDVVHRDRGPKPHLDLMAAARYQLHAGGVDEIHEVPACTRCETESLWSYRRDGKQSGRNVAVIWRAADQVRGGV